LSLRISWTNQWKKRKNSKSFKWWQAIKPKWFYSGSRAKVGEVFWRMSKEMTESTFSSVNTLMEQMMRKVGTVFPFEK